MHNKTWGELDEGDIGKKIRVPVPDPSGKDYIEIVLMKLDHDGSPDAPDDDQTFRTARWPHQEEDEATHTQAWAFPDNMEVKVL